MCVYIQTKKQNMPFHKTFSWRQNPTMLGDPALKPRTMIAAISSQGFDRIWDLNTNARNSLSQFEFALVPVGVGVGIFLMKMGL